MARWVPARADVIGAYAAEVLALYPAGRTLVGVDGSDGAGKTSFARELAAAFQAAGVASAVASLDDFYAPYDVRHRAPDDARVCYEHAYDLALLRARAVEPFRAGRTVELAGRRSDDDALVADPPLFEPGERAVLVVEGLFLHRPELVGVWHSSVWLQVPEEVAIARCAERDGTPTDPDSPFVRRAFGAQRLYDARVDPRRRATALIDATDPAHLRRSFADSC